MIPIIDAKVLKFLKLTTFLQHPQCCKSANTRGKGRNDTCFLFHQEFRASPIFRNTSILMKHCK